MSSLASYLRRWARLRGVREALDAGRAEAALALLADPGLERGSMARRLRDRALELACRLARECASRGESAETERLLGAVLRSDPTRGAILRDEIAARLGRRVAEPDAGDGESGAGAESRRGEAMRELLARARLDGAQPRFPREPGGDLEPAHSGAGRAGAPPVLFMLGVDDHGEYLVASGGRMMLGHVRGGRADLPFLADVEEEHALVSHAPESFHAAAAWRIEPVAELRVLVNGGRVDPRGQRLARGDEVVLAKNLHFTFRAADPASSSAVLELEAGAECEGAHSILLLAPGSGGRVRIGSRARDHVLVAGLEHEVEITLEGDRLEIACEGSLRLAGEPPQEASPRRVLPCPPDRRFDLTVDLGRERRRPFQVSIHPSPAPAPRGECRPEAFG